MDDGFRILSHETVCLSVSNPFTEVRIMKRMFGLLMMVGLVVGVVGFSGCSGFSEFSEFSVFSEISKFSENMQKVRNS